MEDIEIRLLNLESRVCEVEDNQSRDKYEELSIQICILEKLAEFYRQPNILERIEKLKTILQKKSNHTIYINQERTSKLDLINEKIDRILNANIFMNQCVLSQGELIDVIETGFETAQQSTLQVYDELDKYRRYIVRRNKLLRVVIALVVIFVFLLVVKLLY
ncbi:uncharacterized protein VICG_00338 [Vittaforma corneae ATCC 50505]|uniref:t-SNARE coiled-coil homology domain-containing protein n=1 Tax=Vittaforma corneae (strain ATCC 50505) TaxID=993615 RepID=L2GP42_VITCO|nr:uncharacterized protein VICG_00338 [Vittaforma corneae ATCC 50505]ELA42586.1 hypothetical protein VICG_00338 [Vittaforma corneae ATCC 50505]